MKKFAALLMALVLCLSATAVLAETADYSNVKLGVILLHDEDSTYDLNFINGVNEAVAALGLSEEQVIIKRGIPESKECTDTALDLIDEGCNIIFADSFGHESWLFEPAEKYPEVDFCHATGTYAHTKGLANFHNAFAAIYEGRYLAGIAAGADLISQHADSMGAPSACEDAGIPDVSYNGSTIASCPNTFIVSSRINWAPYFEYIVKQKAAGQPIDTDWTGTIATDSVVLTEVNTAVAAEGTVEAIEAAKAEFVAGTKHVFDTAADNFITVKGEKVTSYLADVDSDAAFEHETEVVKDGYFHESEYRSAPYFDMQIDGINLLNSKF